MKSKLQYKGFIGYFEYSEEDDAFCGSMESIPHRYLIYSGTSLNEIIDSFKDMIEGEIEDGICEKYENYNPDEPLIVTLYDEELAANSDKVEKSYMQEAS